MNLFYYLAKLITIIHVEYANVKNVLTWIHNELFQKVVQILLHENKLVHRQMDDAS